MNLESWGSIASILSLLFALISGLFASTSKDYYNRAVNLEKYSQILSRIQIVSDQTRDIKRNYSQENRKMYERTVNDLNRIIYDIPAGDTEATILLRKVMDRVDRCINDKQSLYDYEHSLEKQFGRTEFKDVDTIYIEIIETIKKKIESLQTKKRFVR